LRKNGGSFLQQTTNQRRVISLKNQNLLGSLSGERFTSDYCNLSRIDMISIYLLTAIGFTPGGSSTVHIYTQIIHRTTQLTTLVGRLSGIRNQSGQTNWEECGQCPFLASYTLAFAFQLRKKHGKKLSQGSRRVPVGTIQNRTYIILRIHKHNNKNT